MLPTALLPLTEGRQMKLFDFATEAIALARQEQHNAYVTAEAVKLACMPKVICAGQQGEVVKTYLLQQSRPCPHPHA